MGLMDKYPLFFKEGYTAYLTNDPRWCPYEDSRHYTGAEVDAWYCGYDEAYLDDK